MIFFRHKLLYAISAIALLFTACGSDDAMESPTVIPSVGDGAIGFSASDNGFCAVGGAQAQASKALSDGTLFVSQATEPVRTRGSAITASNLTSTDFEVWAFKSDGSSYMGDTSDGIRITHSDDQPSTESWAAAATGYGNGYWDYKTSSEIAYWPGELSFYAICPSHDLASAATTAGGYGRTYDAINVTSSDKKISLYFTNDAKKNFDFMYATATASASPVTLNFNHAMSQIAFTATKASTATAATATVDAIRIYNAKNGGVFDMTDGSWDLTTTKTKTTTIYQVAPSKAVTVGTSATDIPDEDGASLFLVPQTITAGSLLTDTIVNPDKNGITSSTATGNYLGITCKVTDNNGKYLYGSSSSYETVAVPLNATTWEAGNKYTYDITFPDMELLWSKADCKKGTSTATDTTVTYSNLYTTAGTTLASAKEGDALLVDFTKASGTTDIKVELWLDESVNKSANLLAKGNGMTRANTGDGTSGSVDSYGDTFIGRFSTSPRTSSEDVKISLGTTDIEGKRLSLPITADIATVLTKNYGTDGSKNKSDINYGYQKLYVKYSSGITLNKIIFKK